MKEIRKVINGGNVILILKPTEFNQEKHLIVRNDRKSVKHGDYVEAIVLSQKKNFIMYKCYKIHKKRMVLIISQNKISKIDCEWDGVLIDINNKINSIDNLFFVIHPFIELKTHHQHNECWLVLVKEHAEYAIITHLTVLNNKKS